MSLRIALLVTALALPVGAAFAEPSDSATTQALERELISDRAVPFDDIDISTSEGIVTLTGSVDNLLARERAVRIAETVKGVRAVLNRIQVEAAEDRSDDEIRADIHHAFLVDPATDDYEVKVSVNGGRVTLAGTVDSWHEQRLAERVAKGVRGVTDLQNDIVVELAQVRPDGEIQREIEQALRWDARVDDALVEVSAEGGLVRVKGTVGSAAEKRIVRTMAWTAGVNAVDDSQLKVELWARNPDLRGEKYVLKSPEELEGALQAALAQDPRVQPFDVEIDAEGDGTVTLRGHVDNVKALRVAEQVARHTVGVHRVVNHLRVQPEEVPDAEILMAVREAIRRDAFLAGQDIAVRVRGGVVHMSGVVDSLFEKGEADDVASRVKGVKRIANRLVVRDLPYAYSPYVDDWTLCSCDWYDLGHEPIRTLRSDAELRDAIRSELRWSPFVTSEQVTIEVSDGVATLTGTVDSWPERLAARENALDAGATYVRNELDVKSASAP
ncbi:MAG: BON domain-containing protein [Planctomycetota bacterium]